jgi:TolA-binding protein
VVLKPYPKLVASLAVAVLGGVLALAPVAPAQEKKVKDQAEYDLFNGAATAMKTGDWAKANQLLLQWKEKYPDSDYKEDRQLMIVTSFQNLRQGDKMWEATRDLLAMNPKSLPGLFFMTTLTTSLNNTAPERLDAGEKAARGLLENLDTFFDPAKKPATTTDAQFQQEKLAMETTARKTLGWIAMQRKENEKAEKEFTDLLKANPKAGGQISYWLGTVMLAQKKPEKQVPALWHFARAAYFSEGESLTPEAKKQLQGFLERNYTNYHGGKDGLQELIDGALKDPFPPADFTIESAVARAIREEEELKQKDPQKALWLGVKKELAGPNGTSYFNDQLKGSALPKLKGKVVSTSPAARPKEVVLALSTDDSAEIKLRLDTPFASPAPAGTEIEFEGGVAAEFTADPFLLTLDQEKDKVSGWPAAPRPAPKAGAGKKAAPKK